MASIYLIRHGQASFGKTDYDQLSDKGMLQSQCLGKFWHSTPSLNKIFSGDLRRHQQTQDNFLQHYVGDKPSIIQHSGFNEFNHVDILTRYDEQWKSFADMTARIKLHSKANKMFQHMFSQALQRWVSGQYDHQYSESWGSFKKRCVAALHEVLERTYTTPTNASHQEPDKAIGIFTSAGPISVLVQDILGLSDQNTLRITQQIRNTSVTKLLFIDGKLSIDYLNNYSHLALSGTDLMTFR